MIFHSRYYERRRQAAVSRGRKNLHPEREHITYLTDSNKVDCITVDVPLSENFKTKWLENIRARIMLIKAR
jgi:hypothetical protein